MSTLRARRVTRQPTPRYPTKLAVLATPKLLEKHQPAAWLSNRELAAAAGMFLAANAAGCGKAPTATSPGASLAPDAPAIVAPIFEHGSGRAKTGCVVISPPVFLSEEEAIQVITDELARHGLEPARQHVPLGEVTIPRRYIEITINDDETGVEEDIVEAPEEACVLTADVLASKQRVAMEFVSRSDYPELGGPSYGRGYWSSVRRYDFKEVAAFVAKHVEGAAEGVYFGVVYDPVTSPRQFVRWTGDKTQRLLSVFGSSDGQRKLAATESKRLLREQVKDFVDWLKAQGVI